MKFTFHDHVRDKINYFRNYHHQTWYENYHGKFAEYYHEIDKLAIITQHNVLKIYHFNTFSFIELLFKSNKTIFRNREKTIRLPA